MKICDYARPVFHVFQMLINVDPGRPNEARANHEKHHPGRQEKHVECELMRMTWENVMNPENLMINNALDEIKQAAPRQHGAKQDPAIPIRARMTRGTK